MQEDDIGLTNCVHMTATRLIKCVPIVVTTQVDGKTVALGHVSQFYGRCTDMAKYFGLSNYRVGENAVTNAAYAAKAHNRLTHSQAHRKNFLSPDYEVAGFAVGHKATYQMFAYVK